MRDFDGWQPCAPPSTGGLGLGTPGPPADTCDTFRMRVPGGWLIRVNSTERHQELSDRGMVLTTKWVTGKSNIIFVADIPQPPQEIK